MNKKYLITVILAFVALGMGYMAWSKWLAPTKVALINYPEFMSTKIARSLDNYFINVDVFEDENEAEKLDQYDMLLVFGMGLKLTAEQEAYINEVGEKSTGIYLQSSTTKGLELTNLNDSVKINVKTYLDNGGNKNYANAMRYIRTNVDGKSAFVNQPEAPLEISSDVLFHVDEDVAFEKVADFETYCKAEGFHKEGQKKVLFFTSIPGPFNANRDHLNSMIEELQNRGTNVYPVSGFRGRLNYMKEISPDIIVYLPHGRLSMGGSAPLINQWLKKQNIPVLCPITVHQRYEDWLIDKNGMMGGLLSQSVTMPEFDGGIVPYAVFAEYEDANGFLIFKAVPNRLKNFGQIVANYLQLQEQQSADKKVAFVYFKGPGKSALTAANMEVLPSLHNVLLEMQKNGYDLGDLPKDYPSFEKVVMTKGPVLGTYAEGAFDNYLATGQPELVKVEDYNAWCRETLQAEMISDVEERYGKAPGSYMAVYKDEQEYIAVARVQFGNVVLLPQQMPGLGDNAFQLIHGAKVAPPHTYIAPYLWIQKAFEADAIFHFGTHGSLEFTPGKQIALSDYDWTDPLIGTTPHNYVYTISNVGEGMIAKRRSYAALQTYLTPPFMSANAMESKQILMQKINQYTTAKGSLKREYALTVKKMIVEEGMHDELGLNNSIDEPYSDEEMTRILNFLEELSHEKVTGGLYTMGEPYTAEKLDEMVQMMHVDELAYHLAEVDLQKEIVTRNELRNKVFFRTKYTNPSDRYVAELIRTGQTESIRKQVINANDYQRALDFKKERKQAAQKLKSQKMATMKVKKEAASKQNQGETKDHPDKAKKKVDGKTGATPKIEPANPVEEAFATAIFNVENTLLSIISKKEELRNSPDAEMQGILNALNGGYTAPSPGGDPVANPESVPTGRNLFAVNAEQTPSKEAWKVAKKLGDDLLDDYQKKHGKYPEKISFTLWAGSFIESEGTTIAQILYMLGVEPVWTPRGKMNDLRLMTEEELERPRIDVVVQTSGQLRDLAASRLVIINRAIAMAAKAEQSSGVNFVSKGIADAEKLLIEKGFSPKEARAFAGQRVFGGVNGNYGASIMGLVEQSDRWDSTKTVAQTYINNMGAVYGSEDDWGSFNKGVFEAALLNTEAVVQPRQSNTWGALSLDHVYEFMGGLNLAVKEVTGNDAESYFNDFRNSSNPRVQGLKEAIGVESRTTLLNERYIKEYMKGGASSAATFAETFRNTFGWNVMKPSVVEERLWNDLYDVYVDNKLNLQVQEFFERENPYALQEMTAVMLETVRKGMWQATPDQVKAMTQLHAQLIEKYEAGCSGFVCDNAKLRAFITEQLPAEMKEAYAEEIDNVREAKKEIAEDNVVLKKDEKVQAQQDAEMAMELDVKLVAAGIVAVLLLAILFIRRRRANTSL
ncbi:cobaltochelatase subunit CobN [Carboxylicivirga sp. M1479]|uniref:cobaltochelatase subunit CobN n=1 Tax=Carboxylicivirga sp. M1479 TaxID=2594476 RepID=UPI001178ACAA|nr:cobaltochelatase subunit CobN [Carboxylicivirga sp. M1479]TRX70932.1 cobaltochelatase subunit CobN [Carboxylicivirga sp. M1479]